MARFSTISAQNLMRLIGTPQAPLLIDVTTDEDFAADPFLIPTARRVPYRKIPDLVPPSADVPVVVICQKGKKLSQGAAAILRTCGIRSEALEGGALGWAQDGLPRIPAEHLPQGVPGSLWVTRHRPKIDRIACPWLIRRFIDPQARFLYVPPSDVLDVAEKFDATAFDVAGAPWSHVGSLCSFDAMLGGFGLHTDALDRMTRVIRGADTNDHALAPEAAGLLALSVGLSRAYSDDLEQLQAGLPLYDALYRWARDGQGETHDWQEGS